MAIINLTFPASGAGGVGLVTSAFTVDKARPIAVLVSSFGTTARVFTQWSQTSGGASDWGTLQRTDGSGAEWTVYSGAGSPAVAVIEYPPTPYGRLSISSAQLSVISATVLNVSR